MNIKENRKVTLYRQVMEEKHRKENTPESKVAFEKAKALEEQVWIDYNNSRFSKAPAAEARP